MMQKCKEKPGENRMELMFLDAIQGIRTPFMDSFMTAVSRLGNGGQIWFLLSLLLIASRKKKSQWAAIHICLSLIISFLIVNTILKPWIGRVRPFVSRPDLLLLVGTPKDPSFPSGHTSSSFAAATAIYAWNKKWGRIAFGFAALMGLSRMYLYVHFPTDVLAGVFFGITSGMLGNNVVTLLQKDP